MQQFLLSYDDIYLSPKYSTLASRSDADTSVEFLGYKFTLPIIPSNMEDVISVPIAAELARNGYFYIMHRFGEAYKQVGNLDQYNMSISVGVNKKDKDFLSQLVWTPKFITIDTAHAHHKNVEEMLKFLYGLYPKNPAYYNIPKYIVGNVATADGYKYLCDLGANAVKVGIGGGGICTTKNKTGFHIPTFQSVLECAALGMDIPIIADGGIKHTGDIAKALVAGATLVMCGGLFASCIDSPAKIVNGKKVYRGSTSYESKGERRHIEGKTLELDEGVTYFERLQEIKESLSSAISYAGGSNLKAFNNVKWHLCTR